MAARLEPDAPATAGCAIPPLLSLLPPGSRVAAVGPAAGERAREIERQGFAAIAVSLAPAEILAQSAARGPFDAVALLRDGEAGSTACRLRLLGCLRRWLRPGGLLLREVDPPEAPEGLDLLRRAGFRPQPQAPGGAGWTVARAGLTPPDGLAVATHRPTGDAPRLDLRWCPDEGEWLDPAPEALWAPLWQQEPAALAALARDYGVEDPYGARRSAAVLAAHFGCALEPDQISWGAGATALLHDLAALSHGGPVLAPALTHPDLAAWATAAGVAVETLPPADSAAERHAAIRSLAPGLVHLDRPDLAGHRLPLAEIAGLARTAAALSAIVLIDETYGAYFAGADSAVALTGALPNLVVLRSLSKGALCGGLRAGFAVASPAVAAEVRERVSPLGVSSLAFQMALRLLSAGDLCAPLRARVREVKPRVIGDLRRLGLGVRPGDAELPWVLVDDPKGRAWRALAARGIAGKRLGSAPQTAGDASGCFRLSLPLSAVRLALWETLTAPAGDDDTDAHP